MFRSSHRAMQPYQAQTNTFEAVDTLSDNVASSLAAIGECLTLFHNDRQLKQNYVSARRWERPILAMKSAFESKQRRRMEQLSRERPSKSIQSS